MQHANTNCIDYNTIANRNNMEICNEGNNSDNTLVGVQYTGQIHYKKKVKEVQSLHLPEFNLMKVTNHK